MNGKQTISWKSSWLLVLPALLYFFWRLFSWDFLVDDAYISFRYARNLLEGKGLVFNPGLERVEGYTNLLWTLLLALGRTTGLSFEWTARVLGIVCALGTALFSSLLFEELSRQSEKHFIESRRQWSGLPAVLCLIHAGMILWAGAGLEAVMMALWLVGGVYWAVRIYRKPDTKSWLVLGLILMLLALTRPEGKLFALGIALFPLLCPVPGISWKKGWGLLVAVILVIGGHLIFRYNYYGQLVPNTFYAKVGFGPEQLIRGWEYASDSIGRYGGVLWLILAVLSWPVLKGVRGRWLVFGLPAAYILVVIFEGGDGLPMDRFLVPVVPFFAVLATVALAGWISKDSIVEPSLQRPILWLVVAVLMAVLILPAFRGRQALYIDVDRERMEDRKIIGRWLEGKLPGATIALNASGAIPFYSRMRTIDMLGLNDREIARTSTMGMGQGVAGHEKSNPESVLARRPEIIFIGRNELTLQPYEVFIWLEGDRKLQEMLSRPDSGYRVISRNIAGMEYFTFYLRKDVILP